MSASSRTGNRQGAERFPARNLRAPSDRVFDHLDREIARRHQARRSPNGVVHAPRATSPDAGSATEEIEVDYKAAAIEIGFNFRAIHIYSTSQSRSSEPEARLP